ncbi:MAG TPA: flagellar biosynthesis anti-sigma factor FlgM [Stellaceae bacterium]|nr:flagellar biosynthesis anti-sigma factor FlgM [Stellaceae bacterium]
MPDPIQGVNPTSQIEIAPTGQAGTSTGTAPNSQSETPPRIDSADVARAEALLATIAATASGVQPVDEAKVAELQQAIQTGAYQLNPQQIAQQIIELEALLTPPGGAQ